MAYALADYVTITETDRGIVLFNQRTGKYWQANPTGAAVLQVVLDGGTVDTAVETLRARHPDAPLERVRADVEAVLETLLAGRLVTK
jgi:hypothetical protein